ncbi:MAG: ABC transporter permease [Chloroflexota bacterium]|nr:ABC transporter permease [Chloroflexota bacterium]
MIAVGIKTFADLRRRKLQTMIIAFVILLSSGAATLALSLVVESDAPYQHAFALAKGPHLTLTFDARRVTTARLHRTRSAHGVTAAVGPWGQAVALYSASPANGPNFGFEPAASLFIVGRPGPDTAVDRLTVKSGRWARAPGEVVLTQRLADQWGLGIGDRLVAGGSFHVPTLRIVGIAASISPYTDAWVLPAEIPAMVTRKSPLQYQMLYRVSPAGTAADLRQGTQVIASRLPAGAVMVTNTYLDAKRGADILASVMVPFLLAFSIFALLASVLIITNVVSGTVIASYREIGVMKSVGFTPSQVMAVLLGLILLPAFVGCLLGIPLGTLGSQPFLRNTAHALGLPSPFTAAVPVDLTVLAGILVVATLAAFIPAWRAGHLSAVRAITMGSAPAAGRASGLGMRLSHLPLPRPISLGLADALARPLRSIETLGAISIGVATVVFALSLHLSLGQVAAHLIRDRYVQIDLQRPAPGDLGISKLGAPPLPNLSDRRVVRLLRSDRETARFVAETQEKISVPGIAEPVTYYAYRGPSSWIGYALISGRWFSRPGEVVAPTRLLTQSHLHVGQRFTAFMHGKTVHLLLVGEILDQTDQDLLLRGDWHTLHAADPKAQTYSYEVQIRHGIDPRTYLDGLTQRLRGGGPVPLSMDIIGNSSASTDFILLNSVIAGLALILTVIALAGVFNTVILTTREKVRDVAILKAVGMAPRQVVGMIVASVAFLGVIAGVLGIPVGLRLHAQVITLMAQAATGSNIPPAFFDLIGHAELPLLALAGVAIAALGAWLPAQWAASSGVAEVLQAE